LIKCRVTSNEQLILVWSICFVDEDQPADHCSVSALTELGLTVKVSDKIATKYDLGMQLQLVCSRANEQFSPDVSRGGIIPDTITVTCVNYTTVYTNVPSIPVNTWSLGIYGYPHVNHSASPCVRVQGCDLNLIHFKGLKVVYDADDESRPRVYPVDSEVKVMCQIGTERFGPDLSGNFLTESTPLVMKCTNSQGYPLWDQLYEVYEVSAGCSPDTSEYTTATQVVSVLS